MCAGGPRGAFIPPFVKKAVGGPGGEPEEGPLSRKTLEMLAGAVSHLQNLLCSPSPCIPLPAWLMLTFQAPKAQVLSQGSREFGLALLCRARWGAA